MAIIDVLGERKREAVMRDTWGHMDARPGVKYPGTILFAESDFGGERMVIRADFGDEAGSGPWFYEGIQSWLWEQDAKAGELHLFTGFYRLTRGGDHEFVGTVSPITGITEP